MKVTILLLAAVNGLLLPSFAPAQGTVYLSNLSQPPGGSAAVASDSWFAAFIRTGTNPGGYGLNSVRLSMNAASGNPSGFNVMLYGANGILPGNSLGNLIGADPAAGGTFTYTASGILLSPSTYYFVVLTATSSVAQGSYPWSLANTPAYASSEGWFLSSGYYGSSDGSSWAFTRPYPFQLAVDATTVPEPSSSALVGMGLVALNFWLCKRRQVKGSLNRSGVAQ